MRWRKTVALTLVFVMVISTIGLGLQNTPVVEAQTEPEIVVGDATVGVDETAQIGVNLTAAPNGLTGYQITISLDNPDTASITNASAADVFQPAVLRSAEIAEDNNSVVLTGTDATRNVQAGAMNIPLGSIEVQGDNPGQTDLSVTVGLIQDDENPPEQISPAISKGSITVEGANQPPDADAGSDQTANEGASVSLDATGSSDPDGDTLSYTWTQIAGPSISLTDANSPNPSFTAPDVDTAKDLTFEVEVTDGNGGTDIDTVNVTVSPVNQPPSADAGGDQTVDEETTVELDATGSSDPDDDSLSYTWSQSGGPTVSLSDVNTATPSFTAPDVETPTEFTFEVEVNDGNGGTDTDTVNVTVSPVNQPPDADAGDDQTADEGTTVQIDASGSSDTDGDTLSYAWTQTDGPTVSLSDTNAVAPSFTAPDVEQSADLTFEVEVSDGNGGSDTDTVTVTVSPVNQPPGADAGDDQTVDEGTSVSLDASGSSDPEGDSLSYSWTQTGGPTVTLSDANAVAPSFTAPSVNTDTTLTFEVEVSDGNGGTDTDTVNVTVQNVVAPEPKNQPPDANAGEDQTVDEETTVQLDASSSSDPDGDSLSYAWTQTGGPSVTLSDASSATPSFTAPGVDTATELSFGVEVSDGNGGTDADTVNLTVSPVNQPPNADAGADQTVDEGTTVDFDATGSSDPDGDSLSYAWTQTGGPSVTLSDVNSATPSFTAPTVDSETDLTFQVEVSDGNGGTDTDTANVTVSPVNQPPDADAGDNQAVDEGTSVSLDATGSTDPDGDSLSYAWTQNAGPAATLSDANAAAPSFTAPSVNTDTTLTFEVEVSDGNGGTDTDTIDVTVQNVAAPEPENQPPDADAGDDQTVDEGTQVQLDATGSSDPDDDVLTYTWSQTNTPTVTLSSTTIGTPTFTAPDVATETTLTFAVEATDGTDSDTDTVDVTVQPTNDAPVADAGSDLTVTAGETVELDGSGSTDANGDRLSYAWEQVGGPSVGTLSDTDTATPTLTAVDTDQPITGVLELTVSDGAGGTSTALVNVTVEDEPTTEHTIEIIGAGPKAVYEFGVAGEVTDGSNLNEEDSFSGTTASGTVGGGSDAYTFTGDLTRLFVDGDATVVVDGQVVDPAEYNPHKIEIIGDGTFSTYEFAVSDEITDGSNLNDEDSFSSTIASGTVNAGYDQYMFTGDLTSLIVDGSATVEVDGEVVDPSTVGDGTTTEHTIEIIGDSTFSTYEFAVSDEIIEGSSLNDEDSFSSTSASGTVNGGYDQYTFTGDLTSLTVDGSATVEVDGQVVDPSTVGDESTAPPVDLSVTCTVDGPEAAVTNTGDQVVQVRDIDSEGQDVINGRPTLDPGESLTLDDVENGDVVLRAYDPDTGDALADSTTTTVDCGNEPSQSVDIHWGFEQ